MKEMRPLNECGQFLGEEKHPVTDEPPEKEPFSWKGVIPPFAIYSLFVVFLRRCPPGGVIHTIGIVVSLFLGWGVGQRIIELFRDRGGGEKDIDPPDNSSSPDSKITSSEDQKSKGGAQNSN